jgi:hypothetical protein
MLLFIHVTEKVFLSIGGHNFIPGHTFISNCLSGQLTTPLSNVILCDLGKIETRVPVNRTLISDNRTAQSSSHVHKLLVW